MKLKPDNTARPQTFWDAVRKNGFTPKATRVLVRGTLTNTAKPQLHVTLTAQLLDLQAPPNLLDEARRQAGKTVTVEGILTPGKDVLEIRGIQNGQ